jgi:hypothetical protein
MSCGDDSSGIPSSLGAGYALTRSIRPEEPPCPDTPNQ